MNTEDLYYEANEAGIENANSCVPAPMTVGTPKTLFGTEIDYSKPTYVVDDGVCGFSSIHFPANTKFAKELIKQGIAEKHSYHGGAYIWVSEFGQSYERKKAYASAFAKVLIENGIKKVWVDSRLD